MRNEMTRMNIAEPNPPGNNDSSNPATPAIRMPEEMMHKNYLQQFTQRSFMQLPIYQTTSDGLLHSPRYRGSVVVDGVPYTSPNTFSKRKLAEQDVARFALDSIKEKLKTNPHPVIGEGCPILTEDVLFCKSILMEFATKANLEKPIYETVQLQGSLPFFVSSVIIKGVICKGVPGRNKKDAEQMAACAAIKSMLGDSNYSIILFEIIKSKGKLFDALYKIKEPENTRDGIVSFEAYSESGQKALNFTRRYQSKADAASNTCLPLGVSEAYPGLITDRPVSPLESYSQNNVNYVRSSESKVKVSNNTCSPLKVAAADSGQISTRIAISPQPFHQFTNPRQQLPPEAITLPISFVPQSQQQTVVVGSSSSSKKRKRKKKNKKQKKNKQSAMDVNLNANAVAPFAQPQHRSVSQRVA